MFEKRTVTPYAAGKDRHRACSDGEQDHVSPIRSPSTGPTGACRSFQRTSMPLGHTSGPRLWATPGVRAASSTAPTDSTTRLAEFSMHEVTSPRPKGGFVLRSRSGPRTVTVSLGARIPGLSVHGASIAAAGEGGGVWPPVWQMPGRGTCRGLRPEFSSPLCHLTGLLTVGVTFLSSV